MKDVCLELAMALSMVWLLSLVKAFSKRWKLGKHKRRINLWFVSIGLAFSNSSESCPKDHLTLANIMVDESWSFIIENPEELFLI